MSTSRFSYRAVRLDGVTVSGRLEAEDRETAVAQLAGAGLFPVVLEMERAGLRPRRVPLADLSEGLRMLALLLGTGLPMNRAMPALAGMVPRSWKHALPILGSEVRKGGTIAHALASAGLGIPAEVLGIVAAGEASGRLDEAVLRAAETVEGVVLRRRNIRSALAYPALLAVVGGATLVLLTAVVIPRFAAMLADLGQSLPRSTRAVMAAADLAALLWLPATLMLAAGAGAWRVWVSSADGRRRWEELLLRVPVLGPLRIAAATARVSTAIEALLASGMPLAAALLAGGPAAGNAAVEARVAQAREQLLLGAALSASLETARAVTPLAVRLLRAGEQSGRLAEVFGHVARIEGTRVERGIRRAIALLEPGFILLFAGIVAVVSVAILQAVYAARPLP